MTRKEDLIDQVFDLSEHTHQNELDRKLLQSVVDATNGIYSYIEDMTQRGMALKESDYRKLDAKLQLMEKHVARTGFYHHEGARYYERAVHLSLAAVQDPITDGNDLIDRAVIDEEVLVNLSKPQLKELISSLKGIDTLRARMRQHAHKALKAIDQVRGCLADLESKWVPALPSQCRRVHY